jgi:hypothetical protein
MSKENQRPAFFAPFYAAIRQGGKEFSQVLPAFPTSVRPVEEPGTLGNPTPQQVTDQQKGNPIDFARMLDRFAHWRGQGDSPEQGMDR